MHVLVVDDDDVSREVLELLLCAEEYAVTSVSSGEEALAEVLETTLRPAVVLTDMQMPGISGGALARALRRACGSTTKILAMSGSAAEELEAFDGFLKKPFTMEQLAAAIAGAIPQASATPEAEVLDLAVYAQLTAKMRGEQLTALYELCLDDVARRVDKMRDAAARADSTALRREAHAIRGGCGMVGAVELQKLATLWEERDSSGDDVASLDEFIPACERVRRMLIAHTEQPKL